MNDTAGVMADPARAMTMAQLVRGAAAVFGDTPAIRLTDDAGAVTTLTFAELDAHSALIARGLIARGIGKGSRIGFMFGNGPDFALMLAAIARIGAIAVPVSTLIRANELVRVLRQSDMAGVVIQRRMLGHDFVDRFCDALPDLRSGGSPELRIEDAPYLRWIVSGGDDLPATFHPHTYLTDGADTVSDGLLRRLEAEVHPTDQMIEIYTSGSMALPKGVKHNHGPVMERARYLQKMIGPQRGKEINAQLPMFWVGGLMMYLMADWVAGAITVCTERTLSNSRFAVGAVLAEEDLKLMASKPYWGLGMTETLGPYAYGDEHRAAGRPICAPMDHWAEGYEVRVADEQDQPVRDGEEGEIQVRGFAVTPGLHKVARDAHFTPDGFLRTGDMGLVEGNRVHFVSRKGEMLKTNGSNVSPAEVEMELQSLPGVHNAYVVGLPDSERGQLVAAAVVGRDDCELDLGAIEAELRKRLSSYKVPRAIVQLRRAEVPLLASNKVARREIVGEITKRLGTQQPA